MHAKKTPPKRKPPRRRPDKLQMTYVPLGAVKLWPRNPRRNDAAAERLAVLVREHGFNTPLLVWHETGYVLKGNTGLKAARIAGLAEVPVIYRSFSSEAAAWEYAVSDNKASEWAEWDEVALAEALAARDKVDPERLARRTGFSAQEIEGLRDGWTLENEAPKQPKASVEHECPACGHRWCE